MNTRSFFRFAVVAFLSSAFVVACGTEEEDLPETDTGADTDAGGDTSDTGTDTGSGCDAPNPAGCNATGCGEGEECAPTGAEGCMPSGCACEEPGLWSCTADCGPIVACRPIEEPDACEGENPAGCRVTGCAEGQECVSTDTDGCAPSSCSCDEEFGTWICTEDCVQTMHCVDAEPGACPAEAPEPGAACDADEGTSCGWGEECCCGGCYDSFGCTCSGGQWACFATDACFIESCEGRECESDTDCESGRADGALCVEGVCRAPSHCGTQTDELSCNSTEVCEWQVPGCASEGDITLEEAGCFPAAQCETNDDCPGGLTCVADVVVEPACARATGGTVCDACAMSRSLCLDTGR